MISDTHQGFKNRKTYSDDSAFRPPFPKVDILLHSGDLTMTGRIDEHRGALAMLKEMPAELKLVIAGNHDLTLHKDYYLNEKSENGELYAQKLDPGDYDPNNVHIAEQYWTGKEAEEAGVTYLTEGLHTFSLSNGATFTIYASPWQPECRCSIRDRTTVLTFTLVYHWAFNYPHNEDRWNPTDLVDHENGYKGQPAIPAPAERDPHPIPEGVEVDIIMTHGPPWKHRDKVYDGFEAGCPHLLRALNRVRPRLHCFGHIHEAWGAERVKWSGERDVKFKEPEGKHHGVLGESTEILGSSRGPMKPNDAKAIEERAAYIDVSNDSEQPLKAGQETLLINSSIMSLFYKPEGSGWLLDMELPMNNY